jgi:hypothetical protein
MSTETSQPSQFKIPEMLECYQNYDNYDILELDQSSNICLIYFAGNAIYQSTSDFIEKIVINNRFEWKKNILKSARKAIFVRDIKKQWYFDGINSEINSIPKLYKFLSKETEGFRTICIGVSSGGYAATLFGCLLNSCHVFNFSGQFCLLDYLHKNPAENPVLEKYKNDSSYQQYYSLRPLLEENHNIPIFYFFPAHCEMDLKQHQKVKYLTNIYEFKISSKKHGSTCYLVNFLDLFRLRSEDLINLHSRYSGRTINKFIFSVRVSGLFKTINFLLGRIRKFIPIR